MERKDWIFLGVTTLIVALISIIIHTQNVDERTLSFYITLIGSDLTIIALFFSLYQQFQIKTKSKEIEEKTSNFENTLRGNLYSWNINRAISLTDKLYHGITNSQKDVCLFIIQELQSILATCKTTSDAHYQTMLNDCICCLPKGEFSKAKYEELVKTCKDKCQQDLSDNLVQHNRKLSGVIVALEAFPDSNFDQKENSKISKKVIGVRDYLNDIKPDPIALSRA